MTTVDLEPKETAIDGEVSKTTLLIPSTIERDEKHDSPMEPNAKDDALRPVESDTTVKEDSSEAPVEQSQEPNPDAAEPVEMPADEAEPGSALLSRPVHHAHSHSFNPTTSSLKQALSSRKANSTTELPTIATDANGPSTTLSTPIRRFPSSLSSSSIEDQDRSTIPDPRTRPRGPLSDTGTDAEDEVTALSTKLIDAINYQSTLDDTLSQTRMELEESREKVRKLEELSARQKEFLAGGLWVRKSTVEEEKAQLLAKVREEKKLRTEAEEAKKKIELELESLTAELFDQANKMVIAAKEEARKEQQTAARRYDNLKAQLADTEGLLKSQQEQLAELKQVMEEMIKAESPSRDDQTTTITTPTSPGFERFDSKESDISSTGNTDGEDAKAIEASEDVTATSVSVATAIVTTTATTAAAAVVSPHGPDSLPVSPSHPTSFTHLLRPILRFDTAAYHEFVDLIRIAQINLMLQQQNLPQSHARSPSSTSLPKTPPMGTTNWNTLAPGSTAPVTTANALATMASGLATQSHGNSPQNHAKDLKESKFYKRVLVEDIEPTLRLDTAPGIFWLARRNIMAAVVEGTLVAEPVPTNAIGASLMIQSPCSMCGESRKQENYLRRHRFRLTESDKSTPYPLCDYCLTRVRSVCGFLVFLRMIKEGHWRASDEEAERAAWEECVRLREQMFWARIGGGVLPASTGSNGLGSARSSRIASGGSVVHNVSGTQPNGPSNNISNGGQSSLPSGNMNGDDKGNATADANASSSTAPSPLSTPAAGSGLGIVTSNTTDRPASSRSSKLSTSVAAMVSSIGGHVS